MSNSSAQEHFPAQPVLSVVMPAYNEAATIEAIVALVLASPFAAELIIIDDASTDRTAELVSAMSDPRIRLLRQDVNQGKGAAIRRGFAAATQQFVIVQDADMEYDPADYAQVVTPLPPKSSFSPGMPVIRGEAPVAMMIVFARISRSASLRV